MERYCSTGQSPQRAVAPAEEEEEKEEESGKFVTERSSAVSTIEEKFWRPHEDVCEMEAFVTL
jgi:hypothetical protein